MRIRFDKRDRFTRVYNGARYLVLLGNEKNDFIYNRISYLTGVKSEITSHNYVKIKVDSCDFLPLEETMFFHNVIILIKSAFNKDKNNYHCNVFLEKASYELPNFF